MLRAALLLGLAYRRTVGAAVALITHGERYPLPKVGSPDEAARIVAELRYTWDGPYGLIDHTNRPERLYYHILKDRQARATGRDHRWPMVDCDDFAELARALISTIEGYSARNMILLDPEIKMSHAICWFESEGDSGTIDTNGIYRFGSVAEAVGHFSVVYGVEYVPFWEDGTPVITA